MAVASQKIGHVRRRLIEINKNKIQSPEIYIRAGLRLKDALTFSQRNNILQKNVEQLILDDMKFISEEFFKVFSDPKDESSVSYFIYAITMSKHVHRKDWDSIVFSCRIRQIKVILESIEKLLQNEEPDFKFALSILGELSFPMLEENRLIQSVVESEQFSKVKEMAEAFAKLANGLKFISKAEYVMDDKNAATEDKTDRSLLALDFLHQARNLTKDGDLMIFCKTKVLEGKLFLDYLFNKNKAKDCFKKVIDISLSQQNTNTIWYKEANVQYRKIKEEEDIINEPSKDRTTLLKELETELMQLQEARKLSHEQFLELLFSKFPPVHKKDYKKPEKSESFNLKKIYLKVSGLYHPDKVDTRKHGEKYKVRCEEIFKIVNDRYTRLLK